MIIFKSINKLNKYLERKKNIGFVPTMGSLHKGHLSLIKEAKKTTNQVLVSIFVNPTQFNQKDDFNTYPRNLKKDIHMLKKINVNYLLIPEFDDIYKSKNDEKIKILKKDNILCAKYRIGHFEGVLAVINQFLKRIKVKSIYLGEKDYQQYYLIKKFVKKNFKTSVVICKTLRDKYYFPYSSRNKLLTKDQIKRGRKISFLLNDFKQQLKKNTGNIPSINAHKNNILRQCTKLEYLEIRNKFNFTKSYNKKNFKIFIAYYLGKTRIIDNF